MNALINISSSLILCKLKVSVKNFFTNHVDKHYSFYWTTIEFKIFSELDKKLPNESYWKYCYLWSSTTSWSSFLDSLTIYLDTEQPATKQQV